MSEPPTPDDLAIQLRQRAEVIAREPAAQPPPDSEAGLPAATRRALHELRVHQIELELQNEELRRAQVAFDAARERYFDLYTLAPVGYCTLSERGLILEANLTAADLLGRAPKGLIGWPFSQFILPEDGSIYARLRRELQTTGTPQACELRLVPAGGEPCWVQLAASAGQAADGATMSRVVLTDITERKRAGGAARAGGGDPAHSQRPTGPARCPPTHSGRHPPGHGLGRRGPAAAPGGRLSVLHRRRFFAGVPARGKPPGRAHAGGRALSG
jgi:PAS domain S-box-containing protein